jgi:hypothetical protein
VSWQARAVATLRRICTSARGAVVEQSLVVVSRTVHCLTRTVTISLNGGWEVDLVIVIMNTKQHTVIAFTSLPLLHSLPLHFMINLFSYLCFFSFLSYHLSHLSNLIHSLLLLLLVLLLLLLPTALFSTLSPSSPFPYTISSLPFDLILHNT